MQIRDLIFIFVIIILLLLSIGLNIYQAVSSDEKPPKIEYIKGDRITDTIKIPEPVVIYRDTVIIKELPGRVVYIDTTNNLSIDTLSLIKDYIVSRDYDMTVFDTDTLGKLSVNLIVQYNELKDFNYDYTPVTKSVTKSPKQYNWQINASYYLIPDVTQGFTIGASRDIKRVSINAGLIVDPKQVKFGVYGGLGINF